MLSVHVGEVSGGHHAKYENTEALQLHSSAYLPENGKQRIHKRKMQKKEDADERTHVDGLKALYSTLVSPRKTFISTTKDYDVRLAVLRNFGLHGTKYRNNKMFL